MGQTPSRDAGDEGVTVIHTVTKWNEELEKSKQSNQLMVIDFTASWCPPCKLMSPVFQELSHTFKDVKFVKIDVDALPSVTKEFGIDSMPTFLFIKNGKEVDKLVGAQKKEELERKIKDNRS